MTQVQQKSGWATTTLVLGIVAAVFALLSVITIWLSWMIFLDWVLVPLAVIFGIIALVKKQKLVTTLVGMGLSVVALVFPYIYWACVIGSVASDFGY